MRENQQNADAWPAESRLPVGLEAVSMSATELNQYCREIAEYEEHVTAHILRGQRSAAEHRVIDRDELRVGKQRIRKLERELRHKEKSIAGGGRVVVAKKTSMRTGPRRRGLLTLPPERQQFIY